MRKTDGSRTMARPSATRCRWPPESALRLAVEEALEAQDLGRLLHPPVDLGLARLAQLQAEGEVVVDRHVRVERVALEDHGDVAVLGRHVVDDPVADEELAVADLLQAGDAAQRGGLAAAGGADQDRELAVADLEVQVVDGDDILAVPLVHVIEGDGRHRLRSCCGHGKHAGTGRAAHARGRHHSTGRNTAPPDSPRGLACSPNRTLDRHPPRGRPGPDRARSGAPWAGGGAARRGAHPCGAPSCRRSTTSIRARPAPRAAASACGPSRSIGSSGTTAPPIAEHRRLPAAATPARPKLAGPMAAPDSGDGPARGPAADRRGPGRRRLLGRGRSQPGRGRPAGRRGRHRRRHDPAAAARHRPSAGQRGWSDASIAGRRRGAAPGGRGPSARAPSSSAPSPTRPAAPTCCADPDEARDGSAHRHLAGPRAVRRAGRPADPHPRRLRRAATRRSTRPPRASGLGKIDLIIGAGDLQPEYLAFVADAFGAPLRYVRGNHDVGAAWAHTERAILPEPMPDATVVSEAGVRSSASPARRSTAIVATRSRPPGCGRGSSAGSARADASRSSW